MMTYNPVFLPEKADDARISICSLKIPSPHILRPQPTNGGSGDNLTTPLVATSGGSLPPTSTSSVPSTLAAATSRTLPQHSHSHSHSHPQLQPQQSHHSNISNLSHHSQNSCSASAGAATSLSPKSDPLTQVVLVLLFGLSAHASKNAFAPAQPELERAGLSPTLYAAVAMSPMLGSLFLPFLWGISYKDNESMVLMAVPFGQLVGQLMVACGLWLLSQHEHEHTATAEAPVFAAMKWLEMTLLVSGLLIFSVFHGGSHVVQCAVLTRVLPAGLTTGFVAMVGVTHLVTALCNFVVPPILAWGGIFGVQLALLVPGIVSAGAGWTLARQREGFAVPFAETPALESYSSWKPRGLPVLERARRAAPCSVISEDSPIVEEQAKPIGCLGGMGVVWYIGWWKALLVGSLMSFRTVQNQLLHQKFGLSEIQAGSFVGVIQTAALVILPFSGCFFHFFGRPCLIVTLSWSALFAMLTLCLGEGLPQAAWMTSFLALAVILTIGPVLGQALIPEHSTRSMGRAFGVLEVLFSFSQIVITMLVGLLRQYSGFLDALRLLSASVFTAAVVSVCVVSVMRRGPARKNSALFEPLDPSDLEPLEPLEPTPRRWATKP